MLIGVLGFGRIWSTRPARDGKHAAHFNTTGVLASGKYRHRSCIYGHVRIDGCTGFHPECAHRWLSRVYDSEPLAVWNGKRKLFLRELVSKGTAPELYLVRIGSDEMGWIDRYHSWICDDGEAVSFSEGNGQQEALVLLPAFGWVHTGTGLFHLHPDTCRPWSAALKIRNGVTK
jgi:hypothetical protein